MKFADSVVIVSESYKRSLEKKLTYVEENIVSALGLIQITNNEYKRKQYEKYALGQAEILSHAVECIM